MERYILLWYGSSHTNDVLCVSWMAFGHGYLLLLLRLRHIFSPFRLLWSIYSNLILCTVYTLYASSVRMSNEIMLRTGAFSMLRELLGVHLVFLSYWMCLKRCDGFRCWFSHDILSFICINDHSKRNVFHPLLSIMFIIFIWLIEFCIWT